MKYFVRSLKYLVWLIILLVALVWGFAAFDPNVEHSDWEYIQLTFSSSRGVILIVGIVVLAGLYPLFGYTRQRVDSCDLEQDKVRINNAMKLYGFVFVTVKDGVHIYRASSFLRRLMLRFDDVIEVRQKGGGIELSGMRSQVARVGFQLQSYINNRRYEE
jgi:hypothetical protein